MGVLPGARADGRDNPTSDWGVVMDPISAAALAALAGGIGGEAGRQAWTALSALIHRPFRRVEADGESGALVVSSGEAELTALAQHPGELERAQRLRSCCLFDLERWRSNADSRSGDPFVGRA